MPVLRRSGTLTFLRVHRLGGGYGPGDDFIEGEVVVKIDAEPGVAFGFELRDDDQGPAHQGMLAVLRDAFNHGWPTTVEYDLEAGKSNGLLVRVEVTKPTDHTQPGGVVVGGGTVASG